MVLGLVRSGRGSTVAAAVGAWVAAIVLASPSTGFASPAVTIARGLTDTFTRIARESIFWLVAVQLLAGVAAAGAAFALFPSTTVEVGSADGAIERDE